MSDEQTKSTPNNMGLQWIIIGMVMVISPVWTIVNFSLGAHNNWFLTIVCVFVVGVSIWVMATGVELLLRYDLKNK